MVEPPTPVEGDQSTVRVRRGRVASVDLYEIKDSELDLLEKGFPADLQLNFAIFLLTLAFSAFSSLATATFASNRVQTVFLIAGVVGVLGGAYLLLSWYGSYTSHRESHREVCRRIRERIPADRVPADQDPPGDDVAPR